MRALALLLIATSAAQAVSLGDLDIDPTRIPKWNPATEAEASYEAAKSWPVYDATDPADMTLLGCGVADPADDQGKDWQAIDCALDNAPDSSVLYLPAGTYDMGEDNYQAISISRSNVVLRCESAASTHLQITGLRGDGTAPTARAGCGPLDQDAQCGAMVVSVGTNFEGATVDWTGGYTEDATTITVSNSGDFDVYGWILLSIPNADPDCEKLMPVPVKDAKNNARGLNHIAKIKGIFGNQITLDVGLRMDYTIDAGCTDSATARPYTPISGIGVENCHMVTLPTVDQDSLKNDAFAHFGAGTVESWFVGNTLERGEAGMFYFTQAARNWFQGNTIKNYGRIDKYYNTRGVSPKTGAVDNVIENNVWKDFVVGVYLFQGPEGNVIAYNYMRFGSPPGPWNPERALFNHGLYTRANLFEGNDTDGKIVSGDAIWGSQGPRNTSFRNRAVGADSNPNAAIVINRDGAEGTFILGDRVNWIGNHAAFYYATSETVVGFPDSLMAWHDFDGEGNADSPIVTNMHVEKNMFRNTDTCTNDPTPNRCGFHQDTPRPDTSCGTAEGPGDCSGGTGDNAGGDAAPASWASDVIPHSLYRPGTAPSWWCQEACEWDDVHNGIGAWGDDFGDDLCELPAQIMAEGNPCTPVPEPAHWLGTLACLITLAFIARHRRRRRHAAERVCLTCRRVTPGTWCPYCPGDWND